MDVNVVSAFCIHTAAHPFCSFFFALSFSVCRFSSVNANSDGDARDVIYSELFRFEGTITTAGSIKLSQIFMFNLHDHVVIASNSQFLSLFIIFRNHQQGIHIS